MPLIIFDDVLRQAKMSERERLIEIACRLFAPLLSLSFVPPRTRSAFSSC